MTWLSFPEGTNLSQVKITPKELISPRNTINTPVYKWTTSEPSKIKLGISSKFNFPIRVAHTYIISDIAIENLYAIMSYKSWGVLLLVDKDICL